MIELETLSRPRGLDRVQEGERGTEHLAFLPPLLEWRDDGPWLDIGGLELDLDVGGMEDSSAWTAASVTAVSGVVSTVVGSIPTIQMPELDLADLDGVPGRRSVPAVMEVVAGMVSWHLEIELAATE